MRRCGVLAILAACACRSIPPSPTPVDSEPIGVGWCKGAPNTTHILADGELVAMDATSVYFATPTGSLASWPKTGGAATALPYPAPARGVPVIVIAGTMYLGGQPITALDLGTGSTRSIPAPGAVEFFAPAPGGGLFAATPNEIDLVASGASSVQPIATTGNAINGMASANDALVWIEGYNQLRKYVPSTGALSTIAMTQGTIDTLATTDTEIALAMASGIERLDLDGTVIEAYPSTGTGADHLVETSANLYVNGGTVQTIEPAGLCTSYYGVTQLALSGGALRGVDGTGHDSLLVADSSRVYYTSEPSAECCVSATSPPDSCPPPTPPAPQLMCFVE